MKRLLGLTPSGNVRILYPCANRDLRCKRSLWGAAWVWIWLRADCARAARSGHLVHGCVSALLHVREFFAGSSIVAQLISHGETRSQGFGTRGCLSVGFFISH
jgi:hypothetical protein